MHRSSHRPFCGFASKFNALRAYRCVPGRSFRSVSRPSTAAFPAAGWRSGRCTKWREVATPPSTARRPPCSPPASRRGPKARSSGASPGRICSRRRWPRSVSPPDRVIYVDACDEKSVLACFEEGVRHGGLGAVVAEVARLSMTSSRRLSLAAEASGSIAIAVRRWRRQTEAADFGQPTASATRWRVSTLPSNAIAGAGRRPRPMAARADPMPRRRKRGLCSGCV